MLRAGTANGVGNENPRRVGWDAGLRGGTWNPADAAFVGLARGASGRRAWGSSGCHAGLGEGALPAGTPSHVRRRGGMVAGGLGALNDCAGKGYRKVLGLGGRAPVRELRLQVPGLGFGEPDSGVVEPRGSGEGGTGWVPGTRHQGPGKRGPQAVRQTLRVCRCRGPASLRDAGSRESLRESRWLTFQRSLRASAPGSTDGPACALPGCAASSLPCPRGCG